MVLGDLDSYMQKNETRSPTYTTHKNKLKVDKRLKYKSQHLKLEKVQMSRGEHRQWNLRYSMRQFFTYMFPRARDIKGRINKWDFIKIKSLCTAKENIRKMNGEPTVWENIFASDTSDKGLISKIYKELTWLHSRKTGKWVDQKKNYGTFTQWNIMQQKEGAPTLHNSMDGSA